MALTPPVTDSDHSFGNPKAGIELVEYGDFQCPHCGRAYPIIKRVNEKFSDSIRFVFRNFPLTKIHPQAKIAAVAAESAALQNKFWEMHGVLFEHQRNLTHVAILDYAKSLALDLDKFSAGLDNETLHKKVDKHFMSGLRSGVNATPSFFINGERYLESWEGDDLIRYLERLQS